MENISPDSEKMKSSKPNLGARVARKAAAWAVGGALTVSLIAGGCLVTASKMNRFWSDKIEIMELSYKQQIQRLEDKLTNLSNREPGQSNSGTPNQTPDGSLTPAQVFAQNEQSVVAIQARTAAGISSGSGFVLNREGYVVTNYHVVDGGQTMTVISADGTEYAARLVGGDQSNDIAVLKMEAGILPAATIGSSDALIVGDQVAAVGNALGELSHSLTVGYVSSLNRTITSEGSLMNMIQIDAAINSGNSGGPLFNMKGQVIGITTAKYSGTSSSGATIEGIGFAIPIDDVIDLIDDLVKYGYVTGGYLGVMVSDVDPSAAELYGLPMGVLVHEVTAGGSAEAAGVLAQDIIVDVGGYPVKNMNDLTRALRHFDGGDRVTITVYRHSRGGEITLVATLDYKPAPEN